MSESTGLMLVGVGGAGARAAVKICDSLEFPVRCVLADTDASTGSLGAPFVLLGGNRLSGAGSGGNVVEARFATEDSIESLDRHFAGARLAVVVACLGGGTGAGATLEIVKHLKNRGVPSVVFATMPFSFEGEDRERNAIGARSLIEQYSGVTFLLPMDKLVEGEPRMDVAMRKALGALASGVGLFWRLVEKPGYISTDVERIRRMVAKAGRGRFAFASASGSDRVDVLSASLSSSPLLAGGGSPVRSIFCGVLAGEDLRLAEVARISESVRGAFGNVSSFNLATVNDESRFSGRIEVAVMLLESDDARTETDGDASPGAKRQGRRQSVLSAAPAGRGKFNNIDPTVWNGEDLDVPTYVRRNITLEA